MENENPDFSAFWLYLLHLHRIPVSCLNLFIGERHILRVCVTSRGAWPLFACSAGRACRRLQQPLTFSGCQQTRGSPPVTSAALTWRVKASLRAHWHRPHQPVPRLPSLNKTRKNVTPQKHSESFIQSFPTEDTVTCLLFYFFSLFCFPSTSPKSHANTLRGSICLDWIDGPRAFFLLTKAAPNMVSYRGIMLSCQSVWAGDPRCQSASGTAVSALTTRHAALTCPAPTRAPAGRDATERHDKCIPMSLLSRSIDQYCRRPDWNISPDVFLWSLTYLDEIEGIDQPGTKWL